MLTAGVDVGAVSAKTVILKDKEIISYYILPTGSDVTQIGENVTSKALMRAGFSLNDLDYIIATGYGRNSIPFANEAISEIICHAKGAIFLIPTARTIIDIGGQDSKVIRVNEDGNVIDFAMNDKCAAGTGRFLEVMARALDLELTDLGSVSLNSKNPCKISSVCTVFAESEVVSLRAEKKAREDIIAGIHKSIANRIITMGLQIGYENQIVFTGGVAKNKGVQKALEQELGTKIAIPSEPQIVGALGAALLASLSKTKT